MSAVRLAVMAVTTLLVSAGAQAQYTYRCTSADGKKYYGATIPQQCLGQPIEQMSPAGTVMRRIDPEGDEKQRLAKEAEATKKREDEIQQREVSRRNRALLATYSSEKDIDEARERALAENQKAIKEVEARIGEIKKRQAGYDKEMEFYAEGAAKPDAKKKGAAPAAGAKGGPKPPPKLMEDIRIAETDLKAQEMLLTAKQKDVDNINAKYDDDKKRYLELTGKDFRERARAMGAEQKAAAAKPAAAAASSDKPKSTTTTVIQRTDSKGSTTTIIRRTEQK